MPCHGSLGRFALEHTNAHESALGIKRLEQVKAGLNIINEKLARDGKFTSKAGKVRKRLGRPSAEPEKLAKARHELAKGVGSARWAGQVGLEVSGPCTK